MRGKPQQYIQQTSFLVQRNTASNKVSLKERKPPPIIEKSTTTTCQSIHVGTKKHSIRALLGAARSQNHHSQTYISMTYEDICVPLQQKPQHFIASLLCSIKTPIQEMGCSCGNGNKCIWMDHWLALSIKALPYEVQNLYPVPKNIEDQILKDLKRTQPFSKTFQSEQYQHALYQSLIAYAKTDPQIGYVQGMNIVCSVLLYHNINIYQCLQVFKFLMISCQFRKVYICDFQFTHKLSANLIHALKYRCSDLYRHLIDNNSVNLGIFIIGWILPMLGNIIPLPNMHMKGWEGLLKIILSLLLYLRSTILGLHQETELMELLSVQSLKKRIIPWEEIIVSSSNIKTGSYLTA